jgi:hypothetical protein
MAKLKLTADPTFRAKVPVPIPGAGTADVEFTFKHRTNKELQAYIEAIESDQPDTKIVMDVASGWDLDDTYTAENVEKLCESYAGAGLAVFQTYVRELRGARAKN